MKKSKISKNNTITPEHVRNEIIFAMKEAMDTADPHAQQIWASIPKKGDELTPEEFIEYIAKEIRKHR